MLQIIRAAMRVETNMSLPVPTSGEDGEQSVMGDSHAANSDLVRSEAVRDVDTVYVEAPEELIGLSCDYTLNYFIPTFSWRNHNRFKLM